jgi:glutaredoxin/glutathione-dependent peroxiredoxin
MADRGTLQADTLNNRGSPATASAIRGGMITIGDKLPEATLMETTEFGDACPVSPKPVNTTEAAKGKRIVLFGLPGAYTPTCSAKHVPGYVAHLDDLKARGVDEVWCVSVNDAYVMAAWGREQNAIGKVRMLGDGSAELAQKLGLEADLTKSGMGIRSRRFSLLIEDGIVKQVNVEQAGKFEVSNAEMMMTQLG